jgi:hypothetical protein
MLISNKLDPKLNAFADYMLGSSRRLLTFFGVLLAFTFIMRLWQYGWAINDDGALYLYAARNYIDHGLAAAMDTYPWAYYSVLIAWVDMTFFDNLMISGWTINFFFQCGQMFFLFRICRALDVGSRRLFWLLLLFVISISFHNFRHYLMRDQGFILFTMAGVYCSLIFLAKGKKRYFFLFIASFIAASMFRIEAIVLLTFGFFGTVFLSGQYKFGLKVIIFILVVSGSGLMLLGEEPISFFANHILSKVPNFFVEFNKRQLILEQALLPKYWHSRSGIALFFMYFGSYLYYLFSSLSIYILGLFYVRRWPLTKSSILMLMYSMAIVIYCLVFLFSRGFLVFRYNLPLTYLLSAFSIYIILLACEREAKYARVVLLLFILVPLVEVLDGPSGSKRYLVEAQAVVEKMALNGSNVYSNSKQVSLMNGVEFKRAYQFVTKKDLLYKKIKSPLDSKDVVVLYGDSSKIIRLAKENCLAYQAQNRSRMISVVIAKSRHCISLE